MAKMIYKISTKNRFTQISKYQNNPFETKEIHKKELIPEIKKLNFEICNEKDKTVFSTRF